MVQFMFDELERKRLNQKLTTFEDYLSDVYDGFKFKNEIEREHDGDKKQFLGHELALIIDASLKDMSIDHKDYLESELVKIHSSVKGMNDKMDNKVDRSKNYLNTIDEFL